MIAQETQKQYLLRFCFVNLPILRQMLRDKSKINLIFFEKCKDFLKCLSFHNTIARLFQEFSSHLPYSDVVFRN